MKVLACLSAFLFLSPFCSGETVLLDFTGSYCPPCRQMEPVLAGLEREGYRIERVNVERPENKARMQQYRVDRIPTFIVLTDGQESGRLVGAVPADTLKKMMGPPAQARNNKPNAAQPSTTTRQQLVSNAAQNAHQSARDVPPGGRLTDQSLIQKSVRIVVDDAKSRSFGTGTVIRSVPGETIVLTCAHLFQGVSRQARTSVEFFGSPDRARSTGEVLARDTDADVCLIRVVTNQTYPTAHVAGKQSLPKKGQETASVGCDNGADPTVRHMKVTAINRYVGAPTIECSGEPVEGRSGGGLFNGNGDVIGVCSARDPADHRGIYGGLPAIHSLLDKNSLASLYQTKPAGDVAVASHEANGPLSLPPAKELGLNVDRNLPVPDADGAEVVCVIRSLDNPNEPPKVVLLNRATPEFLAILERERAAQTALPSTSMRLPNRTETKRDEPGPELNAPAADLDPLGWRSAKPSRAKKAETQNDSKPPIDEAAKWQKNWPVAADSSDGTVRR